MTTSPVLSITEELLAELEEKAKAATPGPWYMYGYDVIENHEAEFVVDVLSSTYDNVAHITAANPAAILALIAHIRSLEERLEKAVTDQARYHWLVHQGDSYQWMNIIKVDPDDFESYEEAIDAAIAQEGSHE